MGVRVCVICLCFRLMLLCFCICPEACSSLQPEAPVPRPLCGLRTGASEASCSMLRQIVYLPLALLPPALRIDKHEQRMSALYCCDLNERCQNKQSVFGDCRMLHRNSLSRHIPQTLYRVCTALPSHASHLVRFILFLFQCKDTQVVQKCGRSPILYLSPDLIFS